MRLNTLRPYAARRASSAITRLFPYVVCAVRRKLKHSTIEENAESIGSLSFESVARPWVGVRWTHFMGFGESLELRM